MYANLAALETHTKVLSIFHKYLKDKVWPQDDVVPDRQNEIVVPKVVVVPRVPAAAAAGASKSEDATVDKAGSVQPKGPEDVAMDVDGAKPEDDSPVVEAPNADHALVPSDLPEAQDHNAAPKTEAHDDDASAAPDPPLGRPAKRRRKGPVAKEPPVPTEAPVADSSTRRVTRSRSAANVPTKAPAPAAAPAAASNIPATTAAQASTRVTRSKSGKLPAASGQATPTANGPTTKRGTGTRSAAVARTASGPQTRRRGAASAATERTVTQSQTAGRRTRSRRS
ncbi:hypothetical protein C8T65DRAFT_651017 [Cerioporus squamosus]|nr:hypothetical protein C8T65DRAFT_651017 [Cerioporus squamosus]